MSRFIQLLTENEKLVCELYELLGEKFPEYKVFWDSIAQDEKKHVEFLSEISDKDSSVNEKVLHYKTVQDLIDHIKTTIEKVRKSKDLTMKQAVLEALNIENSIVELKFFEPFKSEESNRETRNSIELIEKDTKGHYQKLKEMKAFLSK